MPKDYILYQRTIYDTKGLYMIPKDYMYQNTIVPKDRLLQSTLFECQQI